MQQVKNMNMTLSRTALALRRFATTYRKTDRFIIGEEWTEQSTRGRRMRGHRRCRQYCCVPSIDHDNRLNSSPRPAKTDIANLLFTGRRTGGRYRIHADERLEFLKHQALCCKHLNATKFDLYSSYSNLIVQEAQLSPRDRATRRNN